MESSIIVPEIEKRRARRALSDRPIAAGVMDRVMTAATLAPSCSNKQPWRFIIARKGHGLDQVRDALSSGNYWAREAPVIVVVTTRDEDDCMLSDDRKYAQFDTGMAAMALMLQATREGLYAHPMAGWDPVAVRSGLGIAGDRRVLALIAVAYPGDGSNLSATHAAEESSERSRKPLEEIVQDGA